MPTVQSTHGCRVTIRVLLALEEAAVDYAIERFEDGHFRDRYGVPGPALDEDGHVVVEPNAVLRHVGRAHGGMPADLRGQAEVDRWIELQARVARAHAGGQLSTTRALLEHLAAPLEARAWLAGDFTVADCGMAVIAQLASRLPLDGLDRLRAYLDALQARPAFARAAARAAS